MSRNRHARAAAATVVALFATLSGADPLDDLRAAVAETRAATYYYELLVGFPGKKFHSGRAWFYDGQTADEGTIDVDFTEVRTGTSVWLASIEPGYFLSDEVERHDNISRAKGLFSLARRLPAAAVGAVLRATDPPVVVALAEGGWLATAHDPGSPPYLSPSELSVRFDREGIPREVIDGDFRVELRFDPLYPEDAMVPAPDLFTPDFVIDHLLVADKAPVGAFSERYLLAFVKKYPFIPSLWSREQSEAFHAAAGLEPPGPEPEYADAVRRTLGKASPWRWPLIGAGGVAVVIGIIALVRRRTST